MVDVLERLCETFLAPRTAALGLSCKTHMCVDLDSVGLCDQGDFFGLECLR